ncbi:hypothetical protein J4050_13705, partial [Winogradskyella sp. DF17]|nr:hypothetical protein [Winogradskyella sp. DF17]
EQKAKQEAEAKAQAEAQRLAEQKAKQEAEAKAAAQTQRPNPKTIVEAEILSEQINKKENDSIEIVEIIKNSTDERTQLMLDMTENAKSSSKEQSNLLRELDSMVLIKDADLKALKEENDLSEKGIAVKPRPFKSITAENNRLNNIKADLDALIKSRDDKIKELEDLYEETIIGDTITNDVVMLYYKKEIKRLKSEQLKALETKSRLDSQLETIRVATEFERRRRIKRAAFDNEDERYQQDRATLKRIKETTILSNGNLNSDDFDFGEDQGKNIKILKNINNTDDGYYLILAVHSNVEKRDEFLRKIVAQGNKNIDFFYDVNTSKYYIYSKKHNTITEATKALESKGSLPYNSKMSIVKIEN